jgi:hypothetical protein
VSPRAALGSGVASYFDQPIKKSFLLLVPSQVGRRPWPAHVAPLKRGSIPNNQAITI